MTNSPNDPAEPLEIRRYSNRRYYDPSRSKHITLEGIRDLVRSGKNVRIVDADSGDDLTARTLTQIILEYDTPKISVLPAEMLHRLIRSSEPLLFEFMEHYFSDAMQLFENSQKSMRSQWSRMPGMPATPEQMASWWQNAMKGANAWPPPAPSQSASPEDTKNDPNDLSQQVAELQKQLTQVQNAIAKKASEPPQ